MLVSIQIYQISHGHWVGSIGVGFLISLIWTLNVKGVVFGTWAHRVVFALGAALGTGIGQLIAHWLY
jgi:hypothetical protein